MNANRLRAALRETADEVQPFTVRPLELPSEVGDGHRRRLTAPLPRWLPTIAAAAAICLIAGLSFAVADGHRAARPASSGSYGSVAIPRYYAALVAEGNTSGHAAAVAIKDSRTGATITTVRPPAPFATFNFLTGAANDRTFVVAAQAEGRSGAEGLFRAQFSPRQHSLTLTPLPMPANWNGIELGGIALSPSGTDLAISGQPPGNGQRWQDFQVSVIPLAGGPVKTWTAVGLGTGLAIPVPMSFGPDGMLAVSWLNKDKVGGMWLLNTSKPGGSLVADSRLLVRSNAGGWSISSYVLSGDGSTMAAAVPAVRRI